MTEKTDWLSIILVAATSFFGVASGMLYAATMPSQAAELGAPEWVIIMVPMGLPAIMSLFLLIPVGIYADRSGKRKELILAALFLTLLANLGLYYANSWQMLVVLRVITGLPFALVGLFSVMIAFLLPEEKRGSAMALGFGGGMLGMGVFQALSGTLLSIIGGHDGLYLLGVGLALLAILLLLFAKVPAIKSQTGISAKDVSSVLANKTIIYTGIVMLLYLTGWQMLYGSFPTVTVSILDASVEITTVLFAVSSALLGFGTLIWGPIIDKFGYRNALLLGLLLSTAATFLIIAIGLTDLWVFVILYWITTFGGVVGAPATTAIATASVKPELATIAINMMFMFINLPAVIGGVASGALIASIGFVGMLTASGVFQLAGSAMTTGVKKR